MFYFGFASALALGVLHPLSFLPTLSGSLGSVWFFNDIVHAVHHPIIFPAAFGLLLDSIPMRALRAVTPKRRALCMLALAVLTSPIVLLLRADADRDPVAPYYMQTAEGRTQAFELDDCLRVWVRLDSVPSECPTSAKMRVSTFKDTAQVAKSIQSVHVYSDIVRAEGWFQPSMKRSAPHKITVALTAMGAAAAALFIWFLVAIAVLLPNPFRDRNAAVAELYPRHLGTRIVLIYALLVSWIPTAIYNNWYANYFTFALLARQNFIIVSLIATFFGTFIMLLVLRPRNPWEKAKVFGGATVSLFGGVIAFRPELLQNVAAALGALGYSGYTAVVVLTAAAGVVAMRSFLNAPEP